MIKTEHLTKTFGQKTAVSDLNLEVRGSEFFVFMGPNAAGKTTTIKLLTGLLRPTRGRVLIKGYDIQKQPLEAKRHIGYIPDMPFLYDKLTAREFLDFVSGIYDMEPKSAGQKAQGLLETFGILSAQDILVEDYSHGMRQRLVFCAALLHEPQVIIIDEPMVGLDPLAAKTVKEALKERTRQGATVFMSTHDLSLAEELADRIGIINESRLIALGTVEELRGLKEAREGNLEEIFLRLVEETKPEGVAVRVQRKAEA